MINLNDELLNQSAGLFRRKSIKKAGNLWKTCPLSVLNFISATITGLIELRKRQSLL